MSLKATLQDEQKAAMRAKDKLRLGTLRMLLAAVKQVEIDERITLDDDQILSIVVKQVKQRKDAAEQFSAAERQDLADKELAEIDILETFLPKALNEQEVASLIEDAIAKSGAAGMQDMGKVMGILKPQVTGRADMGAISTAVRKQLA
ncbi:MULTISPECIES: GatB/YqeY domain-containing protein [unclassified Agarivorans]|uniref:GatB/YqeY domain-containing protein n=1 Tax=unclassified Agarivorans TaxID=2636026 RepID=UPI0010D40A46|nr:MULTISPECIES: GatB/YqeY domain-containing protein [unclassified Agarivorans]MDO6685259.1 GatB/YqeY domain-containing protein [Agarivorans sp. 3_MG-2023]MDO6715569.1 GatB/YqeY domain-containing protein [Agarivorans sp. 2_MG-2023]MDO6763714.1 GatB/YqeY domain-containing protein [Agarivorans sp. 1_MG-2023]GDY28290.1 aspartyl-tRNA amidotransferase subunit B [Agarivorans sp. Toyoura001]